MKTGIYKIINPIGEVYIGQSIFIEKRWKQYENFDKNVNTKLYNSLLKYGWEAHIKEIIIECLESELDELEYLHKKSFIDEFGWDMALFYRLKDGKGGHHDKETKLKMSIQQQFHLLKPEVLKKRLINCKKASTLSSKIKRIKNTNWEVRNKKLNNPRKQYSKIEKCDLNGIVISTYENIKEILFEFNNPRPQNLYSCLKGKYKTWMGFKWKGYFKR